MLATRSGKGNKSVIQGGVKKEAMAAPEQADETSAAIAAMHVAVTVDEPARQRMIAEAAYFRAARRGFLPGAETDDWLAAEKEIAAALRASTK